MFSELKAKYLEKRTFPTERQENFYQFFFFVPVYLGDGLDEVLGGGKLSQSELVVILRFSFFELNAKKKKKKKVR